MAKALKLDKLGKLKLSEADVTQQCVTWLRLTGWIPFRQHVGKFVGLSEALHKQPHNWNIITMGEDGAPDWFWVKVAATPLCRVFYLEFKRPGEKPRKDQMVKHEVLRKAGYLVCVADSLEGLQKWIEEGA